MTAAGRDQPIDTTKARPCTMQNTKNLTEPATQKAARVWKLPFYSERPTSEPRGPLDDEVNIKIKSPIDFSCLENVAIPEPTMDDYAEILRDIMHRP